jgi:hypothetical protein
MPGELARVDELLDDAALLEPFRPFSHPDAGRKPVPMETFLRLMYLKYRYRLGYESLSREVAGIADKSLAEAREVAASARRGLRAAGEGASGQARAALADLDMLMARLGRVVAQARLRLDGEVPEASSRLVSLHDPTQGP